MRVTARFPVASNLPVAWRSSLARARLEPIARHGEWKQAVAREKSDGVGQEEEKRGNVGTEVGNLENGPLGRDRRSYPRAANLHSIIRCNQIDSPRHRTSSGSFYRGKLSLRTTLLHYFWWFVLRTEREGERERERGWVWFSRNVISSESVSREFPSPFSLSRPLCFDVAKIKAKWISVAL